MGDTFTIHIGRGWNYISMYFIFSEEFPYRETSAHITALRYTDEQRALSKSMPTGNTLLCG